jgi:hypothetical protein
MSMARTENYGDREDQKHKPLLKAKAKAKAESLRRQEEEEPRPAGETQVLQRPILTYGSFLFRT